MRTSEETTIDKSLPLETLRAVLQEHSIQLAILFGSHASGETHSRSDIDIAVEFDTVRPSDPNYNEVFFGLSADLSEALGTDNVDLVDFQTTSPELAETIFDRGILLIGDPEHVADIRSQLTEIEEKTQSPRERFDAAVARINRHLSGSAVTATDGEPRDR
ncbi:type VII toxin-antitoxin system MntA family adenylyltransferase antitoxin [Natrinema caseinilyticum]|uniref:type VII toxin-antitoxin system MntA family adenylyltransferase antitoxin n=1 Tax=Natrinema caseinilyticum TaxID=2961570 RepID=UPI0020C27E60|nr:nucleotidyltransferase domain-containing protein [Natrinema caseinilyticum]